MNQAIEHYREAALELCYLHISPEIDHHLRWAIARHMASTATTYFMARIQKRYNVVPYNEWLPEDRLLYQDYSSLRDAVDALSEAEVQEYIPTYKRYRP